MRAPVLFVAGLALLLSAGVPTAPAAAAPCTAAAPECARWVSMGGGARALAYATYALDARNERVTRALVVVHGAGRNADNYFRSAVAAAFLADALDDTIVIAPRFASNDGRGCQDALASDEINWTCTGHNWRSGGPAAGNEALTSFDVADQILRLLARREVFPRLAAIVVAGHSAGGQFVTRYQMANQVHDALGVPVTYVVANPSSYAYLDENRPAAGSAEARPFADRANCTTYDRWPYGLEDRVGYSARLTAEQLRAQLLGRPVVYLAGELDTLPIAGFDTSCPAMAQGPSRLARAQAFTSYLAHQYGAAPRFMVVPLCGHNARCMLTADRVLPILFPRP
jgi:pimeloyl-ACP methyl ester carboxylesterase